MRLTRVPLWIFVIPSPDTKIASRSTDSYDCRARSVLPSKWTAREETEVKES